MEYLQYVVFFCKGKNNCFSFKPYYKWNTFNTKRVLKLWNGSIVVLNLIINGIPSIQKIELQHLWITQGFKPYYKWNTFNTIRNVVWKTSITRPSFKPYYKWNTFNTELKWLESVGFGVLNLIINGIPSIHL